MPRIAEPKPSSTGICSHVNCNLPAVEGTQKCECHLQSNNPKPDRSGYQARMVRYSFGEREPERKRRRTTGDLVEDMLRDLRIIYADVRECCEAIDDA